MNRPETPKIEAAVSSSVSQPPMGKQAADCQTYTFKIAGGCELKLDAYGSDPSRQKPVIVWIHGGALIHGTRKNAPPWLKFQNDCVAIAIDYRLAPETKLPAIVEDVQDAIRWVHQEGPRQLNINTEKLAVAGSSAGGYLTLMTGFCVEPRPRALISLWGYGDIRGPWLSRPDPFYLQEPHISKEEAYAAVGAECLADAPPSLPRPKFYLYCRQKGILPKEVSGHDPDAEPDWFKRYCPVENISSNYPPTLLVHGTADTDVPYEKSRDMDEALTRFKVEHKFITVPGAGHVLAGITPGEGERVFCAVLDFAEKYIS
jgi:acetyl esterase/lipase